MRLSSVNREASYRDIVALSVHGRGLVGVLSCDVLLCVAHAWAADMDVHGHDCSLCSEKAGKTRLLYFLYTPRLTEATGILSLKTDDIPIFVLLPSSSYVILRI